MDFLYHLYSFIMFFPKEDVILVGYASPSPRRMNTCKIEHIKYTTCYWLVVWNIFYLFPYIGNNNPNWLIFFREVETTNQYSMWFAITSRQLVGVPTTTYHQGPVLWMMRISLAMHGLGALGLHERMAVAWASPKSPMLLVSVVFQQIY